MYTCAPNRATITLLSSKWKTRLWRTLHSLFHVCLKGPTSWALVNHKFMKEGEMDLSNIVGFDPTSMWLQNQFLLLFFLVENIPRSATFSVQHCTHRCDKIPKKSNLRKVCLGSQSQGTVHHGGQAQWQKLEATLHHGPYWILTCGMVLIIVRLGRETPSETSPEIYSKRHQVDNISHHKHFPTISHTKEKWQISLSLLLLLVTSESHLT